MINSGHKGNFDRFTALSRMSSSPTIAATLVERAIWEKFQSAVAHELFSDASKEAMTAIRYSEFQSAVAHELFSDETSSS